MTSTSATTATDSAAGPLADLIARHEEVLGQAAAALSARTFYARYPDSPSPRVHGEGAAEAGLTAYRGHLDADFDLGDQPNTGASVGSEVSPYGPVLGVRYPQFDIDAGLAAALAAMRDWRDAGPRARAAVCVEIVDRLHARSFEIANAVQHTSGQPFVMAFQAGGPQAQDRALEAIVAALVEQERIPASARWEKPGRDAPLVMVKDYVCVPRGVALVIGCNTFPTWNAYPGLFASLATGNPVIVKPHPRAVLPLAITVAVCREVLAEAGFDPALVQLAAEGDGERLAADLALRPQIAIIDYTGGPAFGGWLEREAGALGKAVFTEKAGVNTIVIDSTDDVRGMLANLAFSLTLYSGQMCTTPQNLYVPAAGIGTPDGVLSVPEFATALGEAIGQLTGEDARAVELLGATVNDGVRAVSAGLADLAAEADGEIVVSPREVTHPAYPDAVVRTPGVVRLDVGREDIYTQECFGPLSLLIVTDSTEQSLAQFVDTVREHGAMTAAVYSTSEAVLAAAREAALDAGVALSENLTGQVFVNQTAAFSDFHGTGANPAANAAYTDAAFVAPRFRVVATRRHVPA
ncbi:MAG TPA: phenylacetic acid degradation protein PaaN [Intrasporangiaceae bacterium]|nr:phenylacetic acid degradation protein PaaN [Intrasporangiaceae bacterium]